MENLIYILIGIAWVAYSLYTARQKAIQKQQSSGMPPSGPSQSSPLPIPGSQGGGKSLFDDILRELTGESKPIPQVQKPVIQPSVKPRNVSELNVTYEGHTGYKFISDVPADFPWNEAAKSQKSQEIVEQTSNIKNISKNFDLRDAVIFSELLNRKYF
jgi:hypothetical protein